VPNELRDWDKVLMVVWLLANDELVDVLGC
jgi:hypothetical protein